MLLSTEEQQQINELAHQFEAGTGMQVVAAVVGKADEYPDIPWKAFAMGAALAALAVVLDEFIRPDWASIHTPVRDIAAILAAGIMCTVCAVFVPGFGRLFLNRERAAGECRQYAQGIFLQREIFHTSERIGILIVVCRFERRIVILPDVGISRHISSAELEAVIGAMSPQLTQNRPADAFRAGFNVLAELIKQKNIRPQTRGNELADGAVVERGAA